MDVQLFTSTRGIFSKFRFPSDHLPKYFSSVILLEEYSQSCTLSFSDSESEMGEGRQKEHHTINIVFAAALILHHLPLSKAQSSISVALSAHHFGKKKILQSQTVLHMSGS